MGQWKRGLCAKSVEKGCSNNGLEWFNELMEWVMEERQKNPGFFEEYGTKEYQKENCGKTKVRADRGGPRGGCGT